MHFIDLFIQLLTKGSIAFLSGYLSLSGFLASSLEEHLVRVGFIEPLPTPPLSTEKPTDGASIRTPVTTLPSRYERGGAIPRILLDNLSYQKAAVGGAGTSEIHEKKAVTDITEALVNVFCTYKKGEQLHAVTGSGVFIDDKGIILTNAHVAQFLLLAEQRTDARCAIRQGDPAKALYEADLLYISPAWIHENATLIDAKAPTGTGERDYALLYVTKSLTGPIPAVFPAVHFDSTPLRRDEKHSEVYVAGYPAQIFSTQGPKAPLSPKVANTTITEMFTFGDGDADLIAVGDSTVGEQGSSGGPVLAKNGAVKGLIVTRGDTKDGDRSLRALTMPYIDKTIREETGFDLATTLEGNISRRSEIFKKALVPFLSSLLETELE